MTKKGGEIVNRVDKNIFKENFNKLLECSEKNGLQQKQIADHLDVSKQAITSWKTGARTPRLPVIKDIARLFGVEVSYLTGSN